MENCLSLSELETSIKENTPAFFDVIKISDSFDYNASETKAKTPKKAPHKQQYSESDDSDSDYEIYKSSKKKRKNKNPTFRCQYCNFSCDKKCAIVIHERKHSRAEENNYHRCRICSEIFYGKIAIFNHMFSHKDENGYPCIYCDKRFRSYSSIKNHKHTSQMCTGAFKCKECSYWTLNLNRMKQHYRRHLGLRPFQCNMCYFSTCDGVNFQKHRKDHIGENPYICDYCDESFSLSSALKQHIPSHKSEDNYFECEICPYKCVAVA